METIDQCKQCLASQLLFPDFFFPTHFHGRDSGHSFPEGLIAFPKLVTTITIKDILLSLDT